MKLLPGIEIDGLLPALAAPIVFTGVSLVVDRYRRTIDWIAVIQWGIGALEGVRDYLLDAQSGDVGQPAPVPDPSPDASP